MQPFIEHAFAVCLFVTGWILCDLAILFLCGGVLAFARVEDLSKPRLAHLSLCSHVETLLRLPPNQVAELFSFIVVYVDPVVSNDSSSWKLHQFEGLSRFASTCWSNDYDSSARDVDASPVYRVGIPFLLHDRGSHTQGPALALSVVFRVEED